MHQLAQRIQQRAQEDLARVLSALQASGQAALADARHRQVEAVDARIVGFANACAAATFAEGVRASLKRDLKTRTDWLARSKAAARSRIAALREEADSALREGNAASAQQRFLRAAELEFPDEQRLTVRAEELLFDAQTGMLFEAEGLCACFDAEVNEARERLAEARHELEMIDADERSAKLIRAWLVLLDGYPPQVGMRAIDMAQIRLVIGVSEAFRNLLRLPAPQTFTLAELARFARSARDASDVARCA